MKFYRLILIVFLMGAPQQLYAQAITGNILDGFDRKFLEDVWVVNRATQDSSKTNERGYFRVRGSKGDTLQIYRAHFRSKSYVVGDKTHILTEIYLDARTLPTFDLYSDRITIPFNAGNLSNLRSLSDREAGPGKIYAGVNGSPGMPGLTIDGPISYFMKSERQKRQYKRKLEFLASQAGYLEYIQSDSVKTAMIREFGLTESDLDGLIIEFNLANRNHQFVHMSKERVGNLFYDFVRIRMGWRREN